MERIHRMQLWRKLGGDVIEKGAELAETYDMTSQQQPRKRSFPIKKTGEARAVQSDAGPAESLDVNEQVAGEAPKQQAQMGALSPHVDVSSQEPPQLVTEKKAHRYALPSRGLYPLDNYLQVKEAAAYFVTTHRNMAPADRHEYCVNLVKRAQALGIPVSAEVEKYGSMTYAPQPDVDVCLDVRRMSLTDDMHLAVLDKLASCRYALPPEDFALALHEFDKVAMLDQHYGHIPDAYYSTFGKLAAQGNTEDPEASVIIGNEYITRRRLTEYLKNNVSSLSQRFGCDVATEMAKDPQAIFNSLPRDQKLVLMRMANNDDSPVQQGEPSA